MEEKASIDEVREFLRQLSILLEKSNIFLHSVRFRRSEKTDSLEEVLINYEQKDNKDEQQDTD